MEQVKLYLDSNIWIYYLWVNKVALPKTYDRNNKPRERSNILVAELENKKFTVVSSLFNESEISSYFRDYLRFIKGLNYGYDYTNNHKFKDQFFLTKKEREEITSYFEYIANLNFVEVVQLKLDEKSLTFFRLATCEYDVDYMDAFHLLAALINGCNYLITADTPFKTKGNKLLTDQKIIKEIRIIDVKEALNLLHFKAKV